MRGALTRLAAMLGGTRLAALAATLALAAASAGCGGDGGGELIPPESADQMLTTAQQISDAVNSQDCDGAQASTTELRGLVDALPAETDDEIEDALDQMVSRVDEQLEADCVEEGTTDTEEEPTEPTETTETVEPTTTTTVPTETDEAPTEPAPEEEDEAPPPEQPPGEGGGPQGPSVSPPGQSGGGPPTGGTEGED
jgi:hypothetical protein